MTSFPLLNGWNSLKDQQFTLLIDREAKSFLIIVEGQKLYLVKSWRAIETFFSFYQDKLHDVLWQIKVFFSENEHRIAK